MIRAGVGYSVREDAFAAGREAAAGAMADGGGENPGLVIAFCAGHMDHGRFMEGLRAEAGPEAMITGGSAVGVITARGLSYGGSVSGAAALDMGAVRVRTAWAGGVDRNGRAAGLQFAGKLGSEAEDRLLLFFYDSIKSPGGPDSPPALNSSGPLIEGIERGMNPGAVVIGAGLIGDYEFQPTRQFCGSGVESQSVTGVVFGRGAAVYHCIMHGCSPLDGVYRKITKVEGPIIWEIDGRPAADLIDEMYEGSDWRRERPVGLLTIGVNRGGRFDAPREGNYINRLIMGALPEGGGIMMFEPDLTEGMEIQFMLRDTQKMIESARENAEALLARIEADGRRARFGLYIDCAGRTSKYSNTATEEAAEVVNLFRERGTPLLGFYSGVEIAPFFEKSRGLDWTGVLLALAEE